MLTSLVFTLNTEERATVTRHVGRASHGAFLNLLSESDPDLAEALHASDNQRPFTCSTLWGGHAQGNSRILDPDDTFYLRYTGLDEPVSEHLMRWAEDPPSTIRIQNAELRITGATVDPDEHEWADHTTYEQLAATRLLADQRPSSRTALRFYAPTSFKWGQQTIPVPLPDLVYGGLVDKWNVWSNVAVSEEMRRFAVEGVGMSRYQLETHAVRGRGKSLQIGFMGVCQFTALDKDRYWVSILQMLTDYAFYAGIGYQTTRGMGQARRVDEQ
jgi:CRISPR-associated endoribonuclease Cas6